MEHIDEQLPEPEGDSPRSYNLNIRIPAEEGYVLVARANIPFILLPEEEEVDEDEMAYVNVQAAVAWLLELVDSALRQRGWHRVPEESRAYLIQAEALFALCDAHGDYSDAVVNYGKALESVLMGITGLKLNLNKFTAQLRDQPQKLKLFLSSSSPVESIVAAIIEINRLRNRGAHASPGRRTNGWRVSREDAVRARDIMFGSPDESGLLPLLIENRRA